MHNYLSLQTLSSLEHQGSTSGLQEAQIKGKPKPCCASRQWVNAVPWQRVSGCDLNMDTLPHCSLLQGPWLCRENVPGWSVAEAVGWMCNCDDLHGVYCALAVWASLCREQTSAHLNAVGPHLHKAWPIKTFLPVRTAETRLWTGSVQASEASEMFGNRSCFCCSLL